MQEVLNKILEFFKYILKVTFHDQVILYQGYNKKSRNPMNGFIFENALSKE